MYELINFDKYRFGFLIVFYVVIKECYRLYDENIFLLNYFLGNNNYVIVYLLL